PSLAGYADQSGKPVVIQARLDASRQNLLVEDKQPSIVVNAASIFGNQFFAPDNQKFTLSIDGRNRLNITENTDLGSVFQNPWSPNIPAEKLPQMFAALRASGHTAIYVNTDPLVYKNTIHGTNTRRYYMAMIELARREGIKVFAVQGSSDWVTVSGVSDALLFVDELGKKQLDFDGYVLDVRPERMKDWNTYNDQDKDIFIQRYSRLMEELRQRLAYYAGGQKEIFSYVSPDVESRKTYRSPKEVSDVLVMQHTSVTDILAQLQQYDPQRPFQLYIETSLLNDPSRTFALKEAEMASVLRDLAKSLRSNPKYGALFRGFVVNHDTGEDILHVLQTGKGRGAGDRMEDSIYKAPDGAVHITGNMYQFIVTGGKPEVVPLGADSPSAQQETVRTIRSRLEAIARGITGAGNIDHMARSVIETIRRDKVTVMSDAPPLGAEIGSLISYSNILWGQQYTDLGQINNVKIVGVDESGKTVAEWHDLINTPVPIVVGIHSKIVKLKVQVDVKSADTAGKVFPGYIAFLTHHPGSGGVVTETASDEFILKQGEGRTIAFEVPVSREGFNNYSIMLLHGKKFSKSEAVVDQVGFAQRFSIVEHWIKTHASGFPEFYRDAIVNDVNSQINQAGVFSGVVKSRVVVQDFTIDDFTVAKGRTIANLLAASGITELTLDGEKLRQLILQSPNENLAKKQIADFMNLITEQNIRLVLMVGNRSWLDSLNGKQNMQNDLNAIFRMKLPFNSVVLNLGDNIAAAYDILPEIQRLASNEGLADSQLRPVEVYDTTDLQPVPPARQQTVRLDNALQNLIDTMRSAENLQQLRDDSRSFVNTQQVKRGLFRGAVTGYDANEKHPQYGSDEYKALIQFGRVNPYDVSVSVFADINNGDYRSARTKVRSLLRVIQSEQDSGFNGVVHFWYNTDGDESVSGIAPLGNTAWTLKAIFAYIDATGDRSILEGKSGESLRKSLDFVLSQQVTDSKDPRYGLFMAGLRRNVDAS
ncbi:hypothetical protein KDK77_09890, partial [bacterium]|nr:hypothetical protein [bacterium]